MRVSFVIPTRNQAPYLARCLESCLAQNIDDSEILVRDGGSTDGTVELLRRFDDRIDWVSGPDGGQSAAVNVGVAAARGEVIAWLNSDDYYADEGVMTDVLAAFDADPELDILYGDGVFVDPRGKRLDPFPGVPMPPLTRLLTCPTSVVLQPALFFRRRLFVEAGGLDTSMDLVMDYDLWMRMFPRARRYRYLPRLLACATAHDDAKSFRQVRATVETLDAVKRRYRRQFALTALDRATLIANRWRNRLYAELVERDWYRPQGARQ
jgi:glycosyltransferase involved in cell wall biosynthesis